MRVFEAIRLAHEKIKMISLMTKLEII